MLAVLVLLTITAFGTHVGSRYCPRRVASPPVDTVVQKFGGTSVADADRIREVADNVARYRRRGDRVVLVVSAMGKETDHLLRLDQPHLLVCAVQLKFSILQVKPVSPRQFCQFRRHRCLLIVSHRT